MGGTTYFLSAELHSLKWSAKQWQSTEATMKILRLREVLSVTGLPRSTMYDYINKADFPKPISLGERSVGWVESEVLAWIASRIEIRDTKLAAQQ